MSTASIGRVVNAVSNLSPVDGSHDSIAFQSCAVLPPPEAGLTMNRTGSPAIPLTSPSHRVRVHDARRVDAFAHRAPHAHPATHLVGHPARPRLAGAVVMADGRPHLERRAHGSLPRTAISRARKREIGAAALLVCVAEMA